MSQLGALGLPVSRINTNPVQPKDDVKLRASTYVDVQVATLRDRPELVEPLLAALKKAHPEAFEKVASP